MIGNCSESICILMISSLPIHEHGHTQVRFKLWLLSSEFFVLWKSLRWGFQECQVLVRALFLVCRLLPLCYVLTWQRKFWCVFFLFFLFSQSVMSDSLQPHGLQHSRLPWPSPTSRAYSNSCPLSWWCHPTISSLSSPSPPTFNLTQHQGLLQ